MRVSLQSRSRGGFTLTELMITVALIGTLSAVAIPNFLTYQARTRRSEGFTNVAGIGRAYKVYHAESGRFPDMETDSPSASVSLPDYTALGLTLGTTKLPWDPDTEDFFKIVGWRPDGNVYYTYEVESDCGGLCSDQTCFTVTAHGDVDANGLVGAVMFVHPARDSAGDPVVGAECGSSIVPVYSTPVDPVTGDSDYDEPAWVYLNADPF